MGMRTRLLAPIAPTSHKYSRGRVGIIAGSDKYPGAAVLCVGGARRGGAGYIKFFDTYSFDSNLFSNTPSRATNLVLQRYPDVVALRKFSSTDCDAIVVGSGSPKIRSIPFAPFTVLDSSAMKRASKISKNSIIIMTPHEGEARELGFDTSDREECARKMAQEFSAYVVLKGAKTIIAARSGLLHVDKNGSSDLSTAGTGDILAGLIGSMLASWQPDSDEQIIEVIAYAVKAHGLAGKLAATQGLPVVATDILDALPKIFLKN